MVSVGLSVCQSVCKQTVHVFYFQLYTASIDHSVFNLRDNIDTDYNYKLGGTLSCINDSTACGWRFEKL